MAKAGVFFLLVLALSTPFYFLGATGGRLPGLSMLPASALMAFVPIVAATILVFRRGGGEGCAMAIRDATAFRNRDSSCWLLTSLLLMPFVVCLEFGALRIIGVGVPFPPILPGEALFFFTAFFIGAIGEEAGWQGYAYPALRNRFNALTSAVLLGAVWAIWHVVPFVQLGRSADWILWHSLNAVILRIIMVWIFETSGGDLLTAVLFHTMINLSWALFPVSGSFYDPFVTFIILVLITGVILSRWRQSVFCRVESITSAPGDDRLQSERNDHVVH